MIATITLAVTQLLSSAPAEPPARVLRIAVYDLSSDGVDDKVRKLVEAALLEELRKLRKVSVAGMDEVRRMLAFEEQKLLAGCDENTCLSDIAGALGVETLVTGSLARVGEQTVIGLKRIDQENAEVVTAYTQRLTPAGGEEFLAVLGDAVQTLFPDVPLRHGEVRGVSPEIAALLNPPPLPVWSFGIAAAAEAAVVGAVGVGVIGYVVAWTTHENIVRAASAPAGSDTANANELALLFVAGQAAAGVALGAAVLGIMGGTALTAMGFFVDWRGVAE